jgi:DNA (cytosine-5)-methyltransferase 1
VNFLDICSGISAASCAWHPLGWRTAAFAEIDPFGCALLKHRYPDVTNLGDVTRHDHWPTLAPAVDVLIGGTPCQSFSVAGKRGGLDDVRGQLAMAFPRIARQYAARWVVWENVPGVLSADDGRAFSAFLGSLARLGYGFAWRVLDAQFFGLAQRRARVFLVGYPGDWRPAAAVLFERSGLCRHTAPRRRPRQDLAPTIGARTRGGGGLGTDAEIDGALIAVDAIANAITRRNNDHVDHHTTLVPDVARSLTCVSSTSHADNQATLIPAIARALTGSNERYDVESETFLVAHTLPASGGGEDGTGRGTPLIPVSRKTQMPYGLAELPPVTHALRAEGFDAGGPGHGTPLVPVDVTVLAIRGRGDARDLETRSDGTANAILTPNGGRDGLGIGAVMTPALQVRRLTPRECERLQGFADDYTLVPYRGGMAADGPRYRALGNSIAVPVLAWIGQRIGAVESILEANAARYENERLAVAAGR